MIPAAAAKSFARICDLRKNKLGFPEMGTPPHAPKSQTIHFGSLPA